MSRPLIIADQITNLTDARYFAAMGVDYISFNLSTSQPDHVEASFVKQIGDWLSGPSILGNFSSNDEFDFIKKMTEDCALEGLCLEAFADQSIIDKIDNISVFIRIPSEIAGEFTVNPSFKIILSFQNPSEAISIKKKFFSNHEVYLDGPISIEAIKNKLFSDFSGFVFKGGEEEKTGFKSFDELDELFEEIEKMS